MIACIRDAAYANYRDLMGFTEQMLRRKLCMLLCAHILLSTDVTCAYYMCRIQSMCNTRHLHVDADLMQDAVGSLTVTAQSYHQPEQVSRVM